MAGLSSARVPSLVDLVDAQGGVASLAQLYAAGVTDSTLRAHLAARRWRRVHRGVYVTFSGPLPFRTRLWAALLRMGDGAVASHQTAAYLDRLADQPGDVLHIAIPADRRVAGRPDGTRPHVSSRLPGSRHPVRTPPRTRIEETVLDLVDAATSVDEVATWVTRACQRRLSTPSRIAVALADRQRIAWRTEVEAMVADVDAGALSPLEVRYLRRVERAHGLPRGDRNRRWVGRRVTWIDVDLDAYLLRIELDGRVGHEDEGRFRDRRRDNGSTVDGRSTLRYGHAEVFGDECGVAGEVAAVLRRRGWTDVPRRCGPACSLRP